MSKLILIDSMAILHRAYHALPPLTTRAGEPINAVYGLVSMLLRIIQDLKPTHIAFAFDEKEKTFRQKEFKEYQAQREETQDELASQFQKAKDFTKALGISYYSMAGFEADDVIGTIASQRSDFDEIVIVTGDRDILQLVDDQKNIKLYMPVKGLSDAKLFGETETIDRMGVGPKLIPDYKGLVGDPSDNYKGITGIGPKTAIDLLNSYGSFEGIYMNLENIKPVVKEKLIKDRISGEMSYHLAKIVRDVPIKIDFDNMKNWKLDSVKVLGLFEEYGFRTLTKRVKEVGKQIVDEKQGNLF
jgi:DNA polymerase-1